MFKRIPQKIISFGPYKLTIFFIYLNDVLTYESELLFWGNENEKLTSIFLYTEQASNIKYSEFLLRTCKLVLDEKNKKNP